VIRRCRCRDSISGGRDFFFFAFTGRLFAFSRYLIEVLFCFGLGGHLLFSKVDLMPWYPVRLHIGYMTAMSGS